MLLTQNFMLITQYFVLLTRYFVTNSKFINNNNNNNNNIILLLLLYNNESMHTRIGTYSQKSTRDVKLREQSGIFASKATGGGSLRKRNISSLKCCVERQ